MNLGKKLGNFGQALGIKHKFPANTDKRVLKVHILEAKDLLGVSNRGKSCDACVKLETKDLGDRPVPNESFTTLVVKGTTSPQWGEEFQIGHHYSMDTDELPEIELKLFHRSMLTSEIPLGKVTLNLMSVDTSGREFLEVWMDVEKHGRMKEVSGTIRVRLQFSRPRTGESIDDGDDDDDERGDSIHASDLGFKERTNTEDMTEEEMPNELTVMVIRARNLIGVDKSVFGGRGTSDPFVKIRLYGKKDFTHAKHQTKTKTKDLNPVWMESFCIPLYSEEATLNFKVYDYNRAKFNTFLGNAIIPVSSLRDRKVKRKWFTLYDEYGNADGTDRGDLELALQWNHNAAAISKDDMKKTAKGLVGKTSQFFSKITGTNHEESEPEDDDEVEAGDNDVEYEDEAPPLTDEEREDLRKAEEEKRDLLESIQIKDGDWQMMVHLIEARELKAENLDGTSDPIVYVEAFGQKQHTNIIYGQTSCVWDEVLIFNMKGLKKEEFNDAIIRVSVMDWNQVSNSMIGSYTIDAASVYTSNKHHELYREWVGLVDDVDAEDIGVQGYLKLSVSFVGPGEKVYIHDLDAEMAEEMKKEAACGGDLSQLILTPPSTRKEWQYIVCKIFKAEDLPIMDGKVALVSAAGTDAFCSLSFAGGHAIKTKVKTIKADSRRAMQPVFNYELWYPVSVPSVCSKVKLSCWDHDDKGSEMVGQIMGDLKLIQKAHHNTLEVQWYNMYGSHELKLDSALNNLKKLGGEIKKGIKTLTGVEINWYKFYNDVPDLAPSYKGRMLAQFRIEKDRPLKYAEDDVEPFRRKVKSCPIDSFPEDDEYKLKVLVVSGTELPAFASMAALTTGNVTKIGDHQKLKVKVVMGINEMCTAEAKHEKGVCRWNEEIESDVMHLPKDRSQLPDIFVYLVSEAGRPVCWHRIKAAQITQRGVGGEKDTYATIGFDNKAEWVYMKEDKAIDSLEPGEFPGSILMKIGFGLVAECKATKTAWKEALADATRFTNYQVRVHLYQARNLPPANSNGLSDPFVSVQFMGHQKCTKVVKETLFPTWYETVIFPDVSIAAANDFEYAPMINFRVFDRETLGLKMPNLKLGKVGEKAGDLGNKITDLKGLKGLKKFGRDRNRPRKPGLMDKYLGMAQYPIKNSFAEDHDTPTSEFPLPTRCEMFIEEPGDGTGSILACVQLIATNGRSVPDTIPTPIPPHLSLVPASRQAWIEMVIVGVRNLAPYHFRSMTSPYLELSLESLGNTYTSVTAPSKVPNPDSPNFLERIVLPVRMPENSIFATPLTIRVRDKRLGGFLTPIVGTGAVDLTTKIPWCEDTYVAPATQIFTSGDDVVQEAKARLAEDLQGNEDAALAAWAASHESDSFGNLIAHEDDEFELVEVEVDEEILEGDVDYEEARKELDLKIEGTKKAMKSGKGADILVDLKDPKALKPYRKTTKKKLIAKEFDKAAQEVRIMREARKQELLRDDYIVSPEPPSLQAILKQRQKEEDDGAGVFGAMRHIKVKGKQKDKAAEAFTDPDWTQDDGDLPPDWSIGRRKLEGDLEEELVTSPFETYDLLRGKEGKAGSVFSHSSKKVVGKFKGLIRIMLTEDQEPMFDEEMMEQLLKPKAYVARVYLLRATNLVGMDLDMYGNVAKSDPYVKMKLGKFKYNDRKNAVDDMTDVDLYKMVEIDCELPGASQLEISMMDKDHIGSDDLIGRTTIDLEDRWFDSRWQEYGEENMILPGADENDDTRVRWKTKPIERRPLRLPASAMQQGTLECWVDIMPPPVAQSFPADKVALPPTQTFEVRLVIWKAKDVPPQDWLEGMSDLFVKAWPEGCDQKETDTHWRAKKGKASWNYRLVYDVELGHSTRAMKFPYLYLQLWDRDILKWSDCAGEVVFNLGKYYRKAFKRGIAIKLFESASGAAATRARKGQMIKKAKVIDTKADVPIPEESDHSSISSSSHRGDVAAPAVAPIAGDDGDDGDSSDGDDGDAAAGAGESADAIPMEEESEHLFPKSRSSSFFDTNPMIDDSAEGASRRSIGSQKVTGRKSKGQDGSTKAHRRHSDFVVTNEKMEEDKEMRERKEKEHAAAKTKKPWWWFGDVPEGAGDTTGDSDSDSDGSEDSEHNPLLGSGNNSMKTIAEEEEDEEEEMKEQVDSFKNMTGLWDIDPADSDWVHLSKKDHNTDKITPMGSVCISLQIWPKDKANALPAGSARNEPNTNPFLPPPVGRLKWSWNPFVLGSELCGPKLCASFTCCLFVVAFILLMIFCQPFLNIIINLIFVVFGA